MPKFSLNPMKGVTLKAPYAKKRIQRNKVRKTVGIDLTDSSVKVTFDKKNFEMALNMKGPRGTVEAYGLNSVDLVTLAVAKEAPKSKTFNLSKTLWDTSNRRQLGDPIQILTDAFNASYIAEMRHLGHIGTYVTYIYSSKSRVVRGTENLLAVRMSDGRKGWMTRDGRFISQDTMRELLYDVDQTLPASTSDISLMDAWDAMSPQQKADFADIMQDFDWDQFWEEIGSDDPARDLSAATSAYYDLIEIMGDVLGW